MALIKCSECQKEVSSNAEKCPHCGNPINKVPKCKNCGSTNIEKITAGSKYKASVMRNLFGPAASGSADKLLKTWECKDCQYRW